MLPGVALSTGAVALRGVSSLGSQRWSVLCCSRKRRPSR